METSLYLIGLCACLTARSQDRRAIKKSYPNVKKVADGLSNMLADGLLVSSSESPDGWRRRLGAGFPTGHTAEVDLVAVRALRDASTVAQLAGRGSDSAKLREQSLRLLDSLNEKLRTPRHARLR